MQRGWQRLSSEYNIINIGSSSFLYTSKNIISLALLIGYQINVTYYWNLEGFLPSMSDNCEYVLVIWT